jgi:hypothetical protein
MREWMYMHVFLTSALAVGDWLVLCPLRFTLTERVLGTQWIGGWVILGACLDDMQKRKFLTLPGLEL